MNSELLKDGEVKVRVFGRSFAWLDASTHNSFAEVSFCGDYREASKTKSGLLERYSLPQWMD